MRKLYNQYKRTLENSPNKLISSIERTVRAETKLTFIEKNILLQLIKGKK